MQICDDDVRKSSFDSDKILPHESYAGRLISQANYMVFKFKDQKIREGSRVRINSIPINLLQNDCKLLSPCYKIDILDFSRDFFKRLPNFVKPRAMSKRNLKEDEQFKPTSDDYHLLLE